MCYECLLHAFVHFYSTWICHFFHSLVYLILFHSNINVDYVKYDELKDCFINRIKTFDDEITDRHNL